MTKLVFELQANNIRVMVTRGYCVNISLLNKPAITASFNAAYMPVH